MNAWRDVDAPCGRVRAYVDGKVIRARGIRYARAQRFAHPVDEPPVETSSMAKSPVPEVRSTAAIRTRE